MAPHSKKRKLNSQVEEVKFDPAARQQFLTGFRKRKQQRIRHAQEIAEQKVREAKREERRKMREERTAEFERALEEHRRQLKKLREEEGSDDDDDNASNDNDDGDEWDGIAEHPPVDYEAEYIDEDKYTTVTVEEMDPSKERLLQSDDEDRLEEQSAHPDNPRDIRLDKQAEETKGPSGRKPKKRKKKFRYESKEERKVTRMKERQSNHRKTKARKER
ncbi:rRNA-processing protein RRP17 [Aspergillus lucknowensis]|uniref:Nucleolar protein 12-domain-containing protein n=1 Tax=Aspergillus lucknowensis TaxID=176173 RepID=A0ABR4L8M0_9EURO